MVQEAELKSFLTMTTPKDETEEGEKNPADWFDRAYIEEHLYQHARGIFANVKFDMNEYTRPYMPSGSSAYGYSRSDHGTFGKLESFLNMQGFFSAPEFTELREVIARKRVSDYYGLKGELDQMLLDIENESVPVLCPVIDTTKTEEEFRYVFWRAFEHALNEEEDAFVQVVGLKEALKVRVISKGPPCTYFVLKPLQKFLWRVLKEKPEYQLIGEPISAKLLNQRFGRLAAGTRYLSGDYSAATDELHSWVSEAIARGISDEIGLPEQFRILFMRSLTGHTYVRNIGDEKNPVLEKRAQKRGQLMGSITSFPILCIANTGLITLAQIASADFGPYTVNGDDCLIAYKGDFPVWWRILGNRMGLTESIGKSYESKSFCTLYSAYYRMNRGLWEEFKYCNLGLLFGTPRSVEDSGGDRCYSELGTLQTKLVETCPGDKVNDIKKLFLYFNGDELRKFHGPWFLPGYLCGLGLKGEITTHERKTALGLKVLYEGGEKVPVLPSLKTWNTWDYAAEEIRATVPFAEELPFEELQSEQTITCHLLHTWSENGAEALCPPTRGKFFRNLKSWNKRVSALYKKAEMKFGTDMYICAESKRKVLNLVNKNDEKILRRPKNDVLKGPYVGSSAILQPIPDGHWDFRIKPERSLVLRATGGN
jgi:hypothetical protein